MALFAKILSWLSGTEPAEKPMGEMSIIEVTSLVQNGTCPSCQQEAAFLTGPSGGGCQNVACSECGQTFNVTPFGVEVLGGKISVAGRGSLSEAEACECGGLSVTPHD